MNLEESGLSLKDLNPHPGNPRKISKKQLEMLKKSFETFGSLHGIVYNLTTGRLIGGHQTREVLPPESKIWITDKFATQGPCGTVRIGYVATPDGLRIPYKEVMVDEITEKAMNIAANQHGGEFDFKILPDWLNELDSANIDMDLVGFTPEELENIMAPMMNKNILDQKPENPLTSKFVIEVEFPSQEAMNKITETLLSDGYIVKVKNG